MHDIFNGKPEIAAKLAGRMVARKLLLPKRASMHKSDRQRVSERHRYRAAAAWNDIVTIGFVTDSCIEHDVGHRCQRRRQIS